MDTTLLALLVPALVAGVAALWVPRLIALVPEPEPEPDPETEAEAEVEPDPEPAGDPEQAVEAEPKELYADIAALPGLAWKSALVAAVFGAIIGYAIGWEWSLLPWTVALPVCVALGLIDWRTKLLPNRLMLPLIAVITPLVVVVGFVEDSWGGVLRVLLCAVGAYLFYFILWFVNSAGLGFGDVRLSWVLGLLLGLVGVAELLFGLWVGFFLGGVVGLLMGGLRGARKRRIPFGPFMLLGAVVGVLTGAAALSSFAA